MQRVCRFTSLERELLVDPRFFTKLVAEWGRVAEARIQLKEGVADNELVHFRYDVVLHLDRAQTRLVDVEWLTWQWRTYTGAREAIAKRLTSASKSFGLRLIPNARTAPSAHVLANLKEASDAETVADLRRQLEEIEPGIEPHALAQLAEECHYSCETSWHAGDPAGRFDVLFTPKDCCGTATFPLEETNSLTWDELANDPALSAKTRDLIPELRDFLAEQLPGYMVPSSLVVLDALPLTAHGKVDRTALPDPDVQPGEQGSAQSYVAPANATERVLAEIWAALLHVEQVGVNDNFFELGGDSILSIRVIARANEAGLSLTTQDVYRFQTVREQAAAATRTDTTIADQQQIAGAVPLTPIQHWFFEGDNPEPHHFNWATYIGVPAGLSRNDIEGVLRRLVEQHDALRLRFVPDESNVWHAFLDENREPMPFTDIDLPDVQEDIARAMIADHADAAQRSLDLARGPIFRLLRFNRGRERRGHGLLIVNHLVVDAISMPILVSDLTTMLRQVRAKKPLHLPLKTDSIKHWAEALHDYAQSDELVDERQYWLADYPSELARLPLDHPDGINSRESEQEETITLSTEATQQLLDKAKLLAVGADEVVTAVLALALARFTGGANVLINIERHGRQDVGGSLNLARTVGWFANISPALLTLPLDHDHNAILMSAVAQLRRVPNKGIGYGILRYLADADTRARIRAKPEAEVFFNFFGQQRKRGPAQSRAPDTDPPKGALRSKSGARRHLLEINSMIQQDRLQLRCSYSTNLQDPATVRRFAVEFQAAANAMMQARPSPPDSIPKPLPHQVQAQS